MRHTAHIVLGGVTPIRHRRRPSALAVCMDPEWRPSPSPQQAGMQRDTPPHPSMTGTRQRVSDTAQRRLLTAPYSRRARGRHQPIALRGQSRTVRTGHTWCVACVVDKGNPGPALVPIPSSVCGHEGMWLPHGRAADDPGRGMGTPEYIQRRGQTREPPTHHGRARHGGVRWRTRAEQRWATIPARSHTHARCSPAHAAETRGRRRAAQQSSPIPQVRQSPLPAGGTPTSRPYSRLRCDMPTCSQTYPSHRRAIRGGERYATLTWVAICHG
jgi:hypothetical protein